VPEVSVFGALEDEPSAASWASLARLIGPAGAAVLLRERVEVPSDWTVALRLEGLQMDGRAVEGEPWTDGADDDRLVEIGPSDVPEVLDLIRRTEPGPFGPRTIEVGRYLGARHDGEIVAMAGERLRCDGFVEISAVCTAPDHRGRGLARRLVAAVVSGIRAQGAEPFLQVLADNHTALRLYESMGFETARVTTGVLLAPP
jgi:ribosomal protein S18 acetylase RimI-like enzyme